MVIFPPSGAWKALFEKAAQVGLKGNRLLLVVLVVAATIWVYRGVNPWVCIAFVVVVYSTPAQCSFIRCGRAKPVLSAFQPLVLSDTRFEDVHEGEKRCQLHRLNASYE
jgi:hypothetical protein